MHAVHGFQLSQVPNASTREEFGVGFLNELEMDEHVHTRHGERNAKTLIACDDPSGCRVALPSNHFSLHKLAHQHPSSHSMTEIDGVRLRAALRAVK
jgi:hypothetical protein